MKNYNGYIDYTFEVQRLTKAVTFWRVISAGLFLTLLVILWIV